MKVYLLDSGTLMLDESFATWNHNQGVEFRFPVFSLFIDHPDGKMLIDGGIYNPVPFDLIKRDADIVVAIDVVGVPTEVGRRRPSSVDLMFGATQLMMQSIIDNKLRQCRPDILIRPPVSRFRALDFLKIDAVMAETAAVKDEVKHAIEAVLRTRHEPQPT